MSSRPKLRSRSLALRRAARAWWLRGGCVAFVFASIAAGAVGEPAESAERRILTVTGEETVRIPATRARLTAAAVGQAETPTAAQNAVRERSRRVLDYLERSDVERLQAGSLTLHPVYGEKNATSASRRRPEGPQIVGYRAEWNATFEVEAERAGTIADGLVEAGASRIANFEFTAAEDDLEQARDRALREAALRAREKGRAVLDALGYEPQEVVRIQAGGGPIRPLHQRADMAMTLSAQESSGPTAVEPGLVEVEGSATLEIAY